MSKAGTPIKVLNTALGRVDKGWIQGQWTYRDPKTGQVFVCLEGGLFGYCSPGMHQLTDAQIAARDAVLQVIAERYPGCESIPAFNDKDGRTEEEVKEVIKFAIIRLETTGDGEMGDDEMDDLIEWAETH